MVGVFIVPEVAQGSMICLQRVCVCEHSFSPGFSFLQDPTAAHYMFQDDPYLMPRNPSNAVSISFQILHNFPPPPSFV